MYLYGSVLDLVSASVWEPGAANRTAGGNTFDGTTLGGVGGMEVARLTQERSEDPWSEEQYDSFAVGAFLTDVIGS
jgi:hypothetical protein